MPATVSSFQAACHAHYSPGVGKKRKAREALLDERVPEFGSDGNFVRYLSDLSETADHSRSTHSVTEDDYQQIGRADDSDIVSQINWKVIAKPFTTKSVFLNYSANALEKALSQKRSRLVKRSTLRKFGHQRIPSESSIVGEMTEDERVVGGSPAAAHSYPWLVSASLAT